MFFSMKQIFIFFLVWLLGGKKGVLPLPSLLLGGACPAAPPESTPMSVSSILIIHRMLKMLPEFLENSGILIKLPQLLDDFQNVVAKNWHNFLDNFHNFLDISTIFIQFPTATKFNWTDQSLFDHQMVTVNASKIWAMWVWRERRSNSHLREEWSKNWSRYFVFSLKEDVHIDTRSTVTTETIHIKHLNVRIIKRLTKNISTRISTNYLKEGRRVVNNTLGCGADDPNSLPVSSVWLTSPSFARRRRHLNNMYIAMGALRGCHAVKFEPCNNLWSSVYTMLVIILHSVRLRNKGKLLLSK